LDFKVLRGVDCSEAAQLFYIRPIPQGDWPGMHPAIFLFLPQPRILRLHSGRADILAGQEKRGDHHTKTDVVVPVHRFVPVAVRTTDVPVFIVERAAAQHTVI
jgi:hypothetical protein